MAQRWMSHTLLALGHISITVSATPTNLELDKISPSDLSEGR
jgi:hypothetical protein